jgi:putative nucleotidyltransferase with HDIG domain
MVDARDAYTGAHSAEVQALCRRLALVLGADVNTAHVVGIAARLHDIGKVAVPDSVLNKPGALDEREWELMRQHPVIGAEIAARVPRLRSAVPAIRGHHERYDGGGYPDGLAGEDIPLAARIIAVADAFSAMVTDRPYRPARPLPEAVEELHRCAGSQFDPAVVGALESVLETGEIKLAA